MKKITINSISGGKTSSYLAMNYKADYNIFSLVCLDDVRCAPKDNSIINYVNEKLGEKYISKYGEFIATAEDDKTLVALRDLEQLLGENITWVRGESFDTIINNRYESVLRGNKYRLPSWARRYCTTQMKLLPIFEWWFRNIGELVRMNIGFREDEFERMESFFNNSDPCNFSIPISCKMTGKKRQKHQTFKWRTCHFPLVRDNIEEKHIKDYWKNNGWIGGSLFEPYRKIEFPIISNCVGCFHKKEPTLCVQHKKQPEKMNWFSEQENKGMGTWLDSGVTYAEIKEKSYKLSDELLEALYQDAVCDSGGCHD